MKHRLFTSESVTEGHPDKLCDQISDGVLDAMLEQDPMARVACETMATTGLVLVAGEVTTDCYVDIETVVRETVRSVGYNRAKVGFDANTCAVLTSLSGQSPDIAQGVDTALEIRRGGLDEEDAIGAGDQGIVFGFACNETADYMPMPIDLAHGLTKKLAQLRKDGTIGYLRPDGKSQVTVAYENNVPVKVTAVVIATQHNPEATHEQIEADIVQHCVRSVIPESLLDNDTKYYVNPTGRFVVGGPQGDCGLTGRKIIVDTYGGYACHGGGAFSGKDPTKMDRSAAYMARYIAKNIVAAGLADRCQIEVAYAIGVAQPISVLIDTFGTGKISDEKISALTERYFDLRPAAIIRHLNLRRPIFKQTASYGHFGRPELDLPWEKTDMAEVLRKEC